MKTPYQFLVLIVLAVLSQLELTAAPKKLGYPSFLSPHARPILVHEGRVFVVNTPSDTVDVIDAKSRKITRRIDVGIDPVSLAIRPDGRELWVANHVSDSVSVIDINPKSRTYLRVVDTVQDFDLRTKATRFDEPVGIAFASNEKAYVALSSENKIAIVDVRSRKVKRHLNITAQDPRAIVVRNGKLYVIPFESNNKTQLSGGYKIDGKLVTFNAHEHSIANNNVLSLGHKTDIVKHPRVPDRDLYVFDTRTDQLITTVNTLGSLLYGLTIDSEGTVFIAQTDARNDVNGRAGTKKHGMAEMQNRAFLNQITSVGFKGGKAEEPKFIDLEPLPPHHPKPGQALATPFAIQISDDDSTLFVSAAGSDKFFTVDPVNGVVLGRIAVGAVPRGIALENSAEGKASRAWVFNAVANTISVIDVSDPTSLRIAGFVSLYDPTHRQFKLGRTWFNDADASSTRTFSCASCHPDGHTDQLLWVLKTPIVTGGNQIMPRTTMPVRGLRDTAPFHWDGVLGDPYGGINSANIRKSVEPTADPDDQTTSTRHLVDVSMAEILMAHGDDMVNDEGKAGGFTAAERDDMAKFLLHITYPPAQRRAYDNELSERAQKGFELFHITGDVGGTPGANLCGNCHRMPFWVSTNTPGSGMDAPTFRGAYDRFLILPQGRLNIIDFPFYRRVAEQGIPERSVWQLSWGGRRAFDPVWEMVLEGSTGFSGAFARQVTINQTTAKTTLTSSLLDALESTAREGGVVLQCEGIILEDEKSIPVVFQFEDGYKPLEKGQSYSRAQLLEMAAAGNFIGTFTGRHGENADYDHPQPALWTLGPIHSQRGRQKFPELAGDNKTMTISGRHVREGAQILVDGHKVGGSMKIGEKDRLEITLTQLPPMGMHFLQVQNPGGLFSNDFIFHVTADTNLQEALGTAVRIGDRSVVQETLAAGANPNRPVETGNTALSTAAFHGQLDVMRLLLEKGAKVNATNEDGNTPLHVAAFMGRTEIVQLLLAKGASITQRNNRRDRAIDTVSGAWSDGLAGFYRRLNQGATHKVDLDQIQKLRPQIAKLLREHAAKQRR
ncbi:MAG: ankyrin repeat domain-containing protein [Verrucomicrobiota bacterium]|jgi:YVTN family beta-propeller protein|nr:ankyrin repeat domain-containing protein [Verrucomicrobiota bacterium]